MSNPLDKQEGGNHYKQFKIQPIEFITANGLDYLQGNVIKYICRHKFKNGREDVKKAMHYLEFVLAEYDKEKQLAEASKCER